MIVSLALALVLAQTPTATAVQAPPPVMLTVPPIEHKWWLRAAVGANMVAHFADISTTQYALGTGRYREANPFLRGIAGGPIRMAVVKGSIAVGTSYLLLKAQKRRPKTTLALAVASTVGFSYVAARNARATKR